MPVGRFPRVDRGRQEPGCLETLEKGVYHGLSLTGVASSEEEPDEEESVEALLVSLGDFVTASKEE